MHLRRFAALLVGAWLTGGLLLMVMATQNFRSIERLLAEPSTEAAKEIRKL